MAPVGDLLWAEAGLDEGDEVDEGDDLESTSLGQHIFTTAIKFKGTHH
jgi:hypothetical protein